ncbi:hypothetical protein AB0942_34395 [Streptomyces nodosus]
MAIASGGEAIADLAELAELQRGVRPSRLHSPSTSSHSGILALAVMSTAFTGQVIATSFERHSPSVDPNGKHDY